MTRNRVLAVTALTFAVLFWSGNFMLGGAAVASMSVTSLMFIKWAAALIPLLVLTHFIERPNWREVLRHWKILLVLSLLGIVGYGFMFYEGLRTTSGFNASLITALNPAMIVVAATFFLRDRLTARGVIGILIALVGALWALSDGQIGLLFSHGFGVGDLWMFGVISVWTAYTLIIRTGPQIPPLTSTSLQVTIAVIIMAPLMIIEGPSLPSTSAGAWSLAYIAIFPSVGAYILYNYGSKEIEPGQAGMFLNLTVVFTAIFTVLAGQPLSWAQIGGAVLILGGVGLTTQLRKKSPTTEAVAPFDGVEDQQDLNRVASRHWQSD
ncbi:DMT family transporter [Rhodococcus koreensis]|uniref:Permease of the drug/metabolite transporter (DMT) superfamily n=1 Tax=Rhodococcus koreensis TaxID=99653 RepID=A0A1H5F169_9NOCA|nr:DMT family transporter [Rhodococcus koreensis]SED97112.1 Permease of the drug/metabolite transporter (DMT) superfamily [Rhodococcus koreensis]